MTYLLIVLIAAGLGLVSWLVGGLVDLGIGRWFRRQDTYRRQRELSAAVFSREERARLPHRRTP